VDKMERKLNEKYNTYNIQNSNTYHKLFKLLSLSKVRWEISVPFFSVNMLTRVHSLEN